MLDFPNSPTLNQVFGNYTWDGEKWAQTNNAASYAPIASPTFTGDPKAPTPTAGDNDTSIATTAFVTGAVSTSANLKVAKAGDTMTGVLIAQAGISPGTDGYFLVTQNATDYYLQWTQLYYQHYSSVTGTWRIVMNGTAYVSMGYGGELTIAGPIAVGTPTGGLRTVGSINANAVYDDNVLLTCMGIQYFKNGSIDLTQWDASSPTGRHPVAHLFYKMLESFDPRDPQQYIDKMLKDEALPGMPSINEWRQNELSVGEMTNRLWLAMELLASAFAGVVQRTAPDVRPKGET